MRSLIKEWQALADSYFASVRSAADMTRVQGPGLDFASRSMAEAANKSGASYMAYLQHNYQYCLDQARLFQNALDDYLGIEHTNVTDINNTGPDGPQDGV